MKQLQIKKPSRQDIRSLSRLLWRYSRPIIVSVALLVLAAVLWMARSERPHQSDGALRGRAEKATSTGMKAYSIANGGYRYSLQFYETGRTLALDDGTEAVAVPKEIVAMARPLNIAPVTDCASAGAGWELAGKVKVQGQDTVICGLEHKGFTAMVQKDGVTHMVTVTYLKPQKTAIIADLKRIIGSLTITAPGDQKITDSPV